MVLPDHAGGFDVCLDPFKGIVLRSSRFVEPRFYREMGLEPWRADLVVVKNFFHYRLYYMGVHRKTVPIQTRGITDFEMVLEQQEFNDPVHPRDPVSDWRPADARRRGLVHS